MALVELGRYDRNLANIIVGRLVSDGIPAFPFDDGTSIADGTYADLKADTLARYYAPS